MNHIIQAICGKKMQSNLWEPQQHLFLSVVVSLASWWLKVETSIWKNKTYSQIGSSLQNNGGSTLKKYVTCHINPGKIISRSPFPPFEKLRKKSPRSTLSIYIPRFRKRCTHESQGPTSICFKRTSAWSAWKIRPPKGSHWLVDSTSWLPSPVISKI